MGTVYDLLISLYKEDEYFQIFCKKFPEMFEFSKRVRVIPWQDEFAVMDYNPEVIDALEELERDLHEGLITKKEYFERVKELYLEERASKTQAVAFNERMEVSFREEKPSLAVILHELGHIYFSVNDKIWNSVYSGGESLFWLILRGRIDGDEETVRDYVELLKKVFQNSKEVEGILNEAARVVARRYGIPVRNVLGLCLWFGFIPSQKVNLSYLDPQELPNDLSETDCWEIMTNMIEGTKYGDILQKELLKEVLRTSRAKKNN